MDNFYANINMNGEVRYEEKYRIQFIEELKKKPDSFFDKDVLHRSSGRCGTWTTGVENREYIIEKKLRNERKMDSSI
jgi:hypothetical protein